ncbi:MAG: hypothetical protein ACTS44_01460, partial [Candidatus Hodgkinia cicadicola]
LYLRLRLAIYVISSSNKRRNNYLRLRCSVMICQRCSEERWLGSYLIQCLSFASSHDAIVNDLRRCLVVLRGLESLRCWQALEAFKRPEVKRMKRLVTDDFDLNLNIRRSFAVWCFPRRRARKWTPQARETAEDFRRAENYSLRRDRRTLWKV